MRTALILSLGSLSLLAGCQSATPAMEGRLSPDFGDAIRHNINAMAIEPSAAEKADTYIPADRTRQQEARRRYREGEVEEPELMRTDE